MQFLQSLLPNPDLLHLETCEMDPGAQQLTIHVSSTQTSVQCPVCGNLTQRIHSRYERTLADLPCVHFSLTLIVQVCKFFCPNPECSRRIFTERLPGVVAPWARKTARLVQRLQAIGLALGGAAGARLGSRLGYLSCGSTLLNQLQQLPLPQFEIPKVLGVDDFAFRRGRQYGTILVDLEQHRPIALLADRKAQTLADWLREHPGIEVLSRDRSKTYKSAMSEGAPEAIQVADRFHLVENLSETVEKTLGGYQAELKAIEQTHLQAAVADTSDTVVVSAKPTATEKAQQQTQTAHERRIQQQQTIKTLHEQEWSQAAIAQEVGVSIRTVQRYLSLPDFPDVPLRRSTFGKGNLDPYKQQLLEWWNAGIRQPEALMCLLQQQGYTGSKRTLQRYLSRLREAQGLPPVRIQPVNPLPKVVDLQSPPLTPRRAAYLIVLKPENRASEEMELLKRLIQQHPDLATVVELADGFLQMLRQRQVDALDDWLSKAMSSPFKSFESFANGLFEDYAAVKASLSTAVSNGPVEGLNNRLKMLKRQMYGRAGLDLLAKRFIMAV